MDTDVIQEHVNRLSDAMVARGLRQPRAEFGIKAHCEQSVMLVWEKLNKNPYDTPIYKWFGDGTIGEMLAAASAYIEALPNAEETKFREFMGALGNVIDLGKSNGIEVEFLNPLVATMQKLSENALTDQRAA